MATPENTFIGSVHRLLPKALYRLKNNNQYVGGIADCWYSGSRADLWIEYKFINEPARANTVVDLVSGKTPTLSALQQDWLRCRHAEGRSVGVIVGTKRGGVWYPGVSWVSPASASNFSSRVVTRAVLANTIAGLTMR